MHNFSKSLLTLALIGGTALAMPLVSNAQVLQITISDGTNSIVVTDGSANDSNTNANAVSVDAALLAAPFAGELQMGSTVQATFSNPAGSSRLTTTGDLFAMVGGKTWTITSSINNVVIPNMPLRRFTDTNTFAWNLNNGSTSKTTDGIDLGNALNALTTTDNNPTFQATSANNGPNSANGMGPGFVFGGGTYSITSKTILVLNVVNSESQYTTNNIIDGVPEPGSLALLAGVGISGSLFALRMRRRRK